MSQANRDYTTRRNAVSQYDRYPLPFFDASAKPAPSTWNVKPTGHYGTDCVTGRIFAIQFMQTADGTVGWESLLAQIVGDMIRAGPQAPKFPNGETRINGIVIGFMSVVGRAINSREAGLRSALIEGLRTIENVALAGKAVQS